ncbi:MAG: HAMP domain-containing sensor histidine kinase [Hyphomicrobiales bacterium]
MLTGALIGAGLSMPVLLAASRMMETQTTPLIGIAIGASVLGAFAALLVPSPEKSSTILPSGDAQSAEEKAEALCPMNELTLRHDLNGDVVAQSGSLHPMLIDLGHTVLGKGLLNLMRVSDRPAFLKTVSDASCSKVVAPIRVHLALGSVPGTYQPFTFMAHWCHDGCISSLQDASSEMALQSALKTAQVKDTSEDQFMTAVSTLAHELRSPLNSILGFSEILAGDKFAFQTDERRQEYAGYIHHAGQHLLSVVDKMLIAGQLEAGQLNLSPSSFDAVRLCEECITILEPQLSEKGMTVDLRYPSDLPTLYADKDCCRQMLLNILENAMKFSEGETRMSLTVEKRLGHMNFVVEDAGIGIPDEALPRLTKNFERVVDAQLPRPGVGLGLALVKNMAALHGGTLSLESVLGEGTVVTISLPCVRAATNDTDTDADRASSDGRPDDEAKRLRRSA